MKVYINVIYYKCIYTYTDLFLYLCSSDISMLKQLARESLVQRVATFLFFVHIHMGITVHKSFLFDFVHII